VSVQEIDGEKEREGVEAGIRVPQGYRQQLFSTVRRVHGLHLEES